MNIKHHIRTLGLVSALGGAAFLAACGGGGGAGSISAGNGTLSVSMTDAPACGFDHVNVTVNKVRVNQSATANDTDAGWTDITLSPSKKIDLLTLQNGVLSALGQTTLSAGHYTQVRLVLDANTSGTMANSVVPTGTTTELALNTPSGAQSGIKVNTNGFDVGANSTADLVLDFDACKSVVTAGNSGRYNLVPVVTATPVIVSGGITGYVTPGLSHAVVTAQQGGVVIKSTVPDTTGAFTLSPVPTSTTPYVVVVTSDAHATAAITGVPVTAGTTVQLSSSTAPIAPAASAMGTISGTVSPTTASATVRALQSLGASGTSVEVGFNLADATTGANSLSLPVGAVSLGAYATTLPITLSTTATLVSAGKYSVEASATGYTKQTADVDISTTNATKNFTLTP